jgi:hypothetical protein
LISCCYGWIPRRYACAQLSTRVSARLHACAPKVHGCCMRTRKCKCLRACGELVRACVSLCVCPRCLCCPRALYCVCARVRACVRALNVCTHTCACVRLCARSPHLGYRADTARRQQPRPPSQVQRCPRPASRRLVHDAKTLQVLPVAMQIAPRPHPPMVAPSPPQGAHGYHLPAAAGTAAAALRAASRPVCRLTAPARPSVHTVVRRWWIRGGRLRPRAIQ